MVGMCSDKDAFYGYIDRVCTYLSLFRRKLPMYISTIISAYVSMIDLKKILTEAYIFSFKLQNCCSIYLELNRIELKIFAKGPVFFDK